MNSTHNYIINNKYDDKSINITIIIILVIIMLLFQLLLISYILIIKIYNYYNNNYNNYELSSLIITETINDEHNNDDFYYANKIKCPYCRLIQDTQLYYLRYIKNECCSICLEEEEWFIECKRTTRHILCCINCHKSLCKNLVQKKICKWCNTSREYIEPREYSHGLFYGWCGKCE